MRLHLATRSNFIATLNLLLAAAFFTVGLNAQATGYWHTDGNRILDSNNVPVRIAGVNWYGFENHHEVVQGLWIQDYHTVLNSIKNNGYNTIRLPFSNQMVESPIIPDNIQYNVGDYAINTDLQGLNSLQIMDKIIEYAGQIGLHVILDNHRSSAGDSGTETGLWYTSSYPEGVWLQDWQTLVTRYMNNSTVIGVDLRNEPHDAHNGGSCWGGSLNCTPDRDWQLAAQRGGNAVQSINPNLLIFVEGTDCYDSDCNWWGGNLEGVQYHPVQLNVSNHLVYSAHEYGPGLYQQPWFDSSTSYNSLSARYTKFWGYVSQWWIAPVWVGEFGAANNSDLQGNAAGSEGQWFQSMITYLHNNPAMHWTYWAINGEDVDGLLDLNYRATPANPFKQQMLATIQSPIVKASLRFVPVTPCRIADTRTESGPFGGPLLRGGTSRDFVIPNSACSIPANVQAYSLNVTVVPSGKLGFLTVWPAGQSRPGVSTLNSPDGRIKANAAIIPAGGQRGISVFVTDDTHFVLDINGYFVLATDNPAQAFYPVTPCRVADTRNAAGPLGAPSLSANQSRNFPVLLSACGLPANAQAYSLNFTVVPRGPLGYLATWPAGQTQPVVSTLNATTGAVTANGAIVPAGASGDISVFATNDTDLVIDVNGYFAAPGPGGLSLYNVQPCRVRDTRDDRNSIGGISGTLGARVTGSVCDVGNDAQAYVMNATVIPQAVQGSPASLAYLTLYPDGQTRPVVSTLNANDGQITSNMAVVPAGNLGFIDAYATSWTHLILDISSYFAP
jgi:aryl-phospho-beta-D-glucosidase BglC (GH1 family)